MQIYQDQDKKATNNYKNILDGLKKILSAGLKLPVYVDEDSHSADYIRLTPTGMDYVDSQNSGTTFTYNVDIDYHISAELRIETKTQRLHDIVDLLNTNYYYRPTTITYWFDAHVSTVIIGDTEDDYVIKIIWEGTHN